MCYVSPVWSTGRFMAVLGVLCKRLSLYAKMPNTRRCSYFELGLPVVLIAGSVHRCVGEQVISSKTSSLSRNSYVPVNFHKPYPSMSTNWSWDCSLRRDVWVKGYHGSVQMTSLPSSFKERKGKSKFLCCCRSQCLLTGNRQNVRKVCFFYSESYT